MKENEKNLKEYKLSSQKYNEDYNELNQKVIQLEKEINKLKKENKSLVNKNTDLLNDNESLLNENNKNNKLISSYKEKINNLNDEISSLKEIIEKYKKEIEELKLIIKEKEKESNENKNDNNNKVNSNNNSLYEDEIVIVNKETTYSKAYGGGTDIKKNGEFKNKIEIKKKGDLNESEIMKYHEIIQDLSNMILIYENFFFKKKVKPKNNNELLCFLIVEYINNRIKKIKLNAFINLIIYKETHPKINKYKNKNNIYTRSTNDITEMNSDYGVNYKRRKPYISGRSKNKIKSEEE